MQLPDLFFDILGWVGSVLLVISILQTRIDHLRWLNVAACAVLIVYNVWLPSWPMVAMNTALVAINLFNLIRLRKTPAGLPNKQQNLLLPIRQDSGKHDRADETQLPDARTRPSAHRC
ncbi:YgjV family protein [Paenarthrobacter sp. RAF54_2]|uniref:YgjV family protein n=1 Tax=Paenarthrobacter sp. RAF54_2 TaxID=3233061 RepID=UPI003F95605D